MTRQDEKDLKAYFDGKFGGLVAGLDEKFAGIDEKFAGIDEKFAGVTAKLANLEEGQNSLATRLGGIEKHLDKQDEDLEQRTRSILETIEESRQDARGWASRLFVLLDTDLKKQKPALDEHGAPAARLTRMPGDKTPRGRKRRDDH